MFDDAEARRLLRTSGTDQAEMSAKDLASVLGSFRKELILQGFDTDAVWEMCHQFFDAMLDNGAAVADDEDD